VVKELDSSYSVIFGIEVKKGEGKLRIGFGIVKNNERVNDCNAPEVLHLLAETKFFKVDYPTSDRWWLFVEETSDLVFNPESESYIKLMYDGDAFYEYAELYFEKMKSVYRASVNGN
jgi:hypothetical protein